MPDSHRIFSLLNPAAIENEKLFVRFCRIVRSQEGGDQQELGVEGQLHAQTRWFGN